MSHRPFVTALVLALPGIARADVPVYGSPSFLLAAIIIGVAAIILIVALVRRRKR